MPGTDLFISEAGTTSGIEVVLTDENGDAIFVKCPNSSIPTGQAGYAVGCICANTTTGYILVNQGTTSAASFRTMQVS